MLWLSTIISAIAMVSAVSAVPPPDKVTGDTILHDPTMCKDNSGTYFLFSTGVGIEIRTSTDRVAWKMLGKVFPDGAPWTDHYTNKTNGALWAPDCTYLDGQFHLYYAASTGGSRVSAIFLAKSGTGQPGSFSNEGLIIETDDSDQYNAIDPNLLIDGNAWRLSFGSFWTGIKEIQIDPATGNRSSNTIIPLAEIPGNTRVIEGNTIYKFNNFFYLFSSWDKCCIGSNSTYNIRVGRSTSATGGFVDQDGVALTKGGGTLLLGAHDDIVAAGGEDLMDDKDGPIMIYHYYTSNSSHNFLGFLGINRLNFSSGWPIVI